MTAALLGAALITLNPAPTGMTIPARYVVAFAGAQERAMTTGLEEFYCLVGYVDRQGVHHVRAVIKPKQRAWIERTFFGFALYHLINHDPCPPGTVADFHTHPGSQYYAGNPSPIDRKTNSELPYRLHLISWSCGPQRVCIRAWISVLDKVDETRPLTGRLVAL